MSALGRRGFLGLGAGAALALGLTGCLSAASPAARARRSEAVIGLSAAVTTLDPMNTTSVGTDLSVLSSVYSSLVTRRPDLSIGPDAAVSWDRPEPTRWRFRLDGNAAFADGTPLDAEAVAWNVARLLDAGNALRMTSNFPLLRGAEPVDAHTVDLVTSEPDADLPAALSFLYLLSPGWTARHNPATEAMGSGPYEIVRYSPGGNVELRARSGYWGPAPAIRDITFRITPSESARVSGLLSGELDMVAGLDPQDLERLAADRALTVHQLDTTRMAFIKLNTLAGPMRDIRVRHAVNYAVDKRAITGSLLKDTVEPSPGQLLTADYAGHDDGLTGYPYDPERARALLAEAGFGPGRPLSVELTVPSGQYVAGDLIVQAVAQQLRQVGVRASINSIPFTVYMQKYLVDQDMSDMQYITQAWPTLAAGGLYGLFVSDSPYAYWADEEFTDAVTEARASTDTARRDELYAAAARRAREQAPVLFLFPQPGIHGTAKNLRWRPRPDDWVRPAEMAWKEAA
ncbi:ABC transporter substrate-binding protein [Streptomyces johnsoniae]|uniref:ABC transporter substrate-binding protein n=1 Tax=Streptomyces johnsoniae TaxID=3075532 RepID=A0ABU2S1C8_9ACTN|nr:ABC transporter substrate-binding protein [Streptomyces sp. DSM 41886]MDT0442593.1 ABC transporter substrate-binding protein [Streptomyces sp. DSM 41886]